MSREDELLEQLNDVRRKRDQVSDEYHAARRQNDEMSSQIIDRKKGVMKELEDPDSHLTSRQRELLEEQLSICSELEKIHEQISDGIEKGYQDANVKMDEEEASVQEEIRHLEQDGADDNRNSDTMD